MVIVEEPTLIGPEEIGGFSSLMGRRLSISVPYLGSEESTELYGGSMCMMPGSKGCPGWWWRTPASG